MPRGPIRAIKEITRTTGILGPVMIAAAITLLIVGVIWAAHHDQLF